MDDMLRHPDRAMWMTFTGWYHRRGSEYMIRIVFNNELNLCDYLPLTPKIPQDYYKEWCRVGPVREALHLDPLLIDFEYPH